MSDQRISEEDRKVADALRNSWVYHLPQWIWPFAQLARWERPIGWWLLMWPCWWSLMLAWNLSGMGADGVWKISLFMALFMAGAFLMRGAGCTYNDLVDVDIDNQVARTRSRPLPSGRVTRKSAFVFMVLQLLAGLAVLLQFDSTVILLGIASLATVLIYPFMKRITWWPQLFLGLAFSWGALVGWWTLGGIDPFEIGNWMVPVTLYLGCICWVIGYDTIYAHQDIEDDALVGVMSTARLFGENTRPALAVLYAVALALFAVACSLTGVGWPAWLGLAAGAVHMVWQIRSVNINDPACCLKLFRSNSHFGWIFFCGLLASALISG